MSPTLSSHPDGSVYTWQAGPSRFRALPGKGARLMDWNVQFAGNKNRSVIHWPENVPADTPFSKIRGGNPVLFPFASRSYHKGREFAWKTPAGDVLDMPQHGFSREATFQLETVGDQGFTALLQPDENARAIYPFQYEFRVEYQFSDLALKVIFTLLNKDECAIPWAAGHHFYFTMPWIGGTSWSHYQLHLNARKSTYFSKEGKLHPEKLEKGPIDFDDSRLSDRIHFELRDRRLHFGPKSGEEPVFITIGEDKLPPKHTAVVTWSASENEPYYCVEPWMGLPNAPEHGKGLHWVEPGQQQTFAVEVSLY